MRQLFTILCILITGFVGYSQTVGLVLSGGGATGMAHVGVLKALEEQGIQIDYITGTSAGALVGSMYAAGYSPSQIDSMVRTDVFQLMVKGMIEGQYEYFYVRSEPDASWINLKVNRDSVLNSLPTNLTNSTLADFETMRLLSGASAAAGNNFDSLFVGFRCVASDISAKQSVIFKQGDLSANVRASMTYPFYFHPVTVDGKLLFDGGLYNNFPADVMREEFNPDFVIGSNVSGNISPAAGNNVLSQVLNMIVDRSDFELHGNGIMIEPQLDDVGTFDFENLESAIQIGYQTTMALMDSIKSLGFPQRQVDEVQKSRRKFNKTKPDLSVGTVHISGVNDRQAYYIRRILKKNPEPLNFATFKKRYFRVATSDKVGFTYPTLRYNSTDSIYDLYLHIEKDKEIRVEVGGNFSSRPINTGYLGLEYNQFGKRGFKLFANSYFGKFYGSVLAGVRLDFPSALPFYVEPYYSLNRWDYFKSFATFFEDVKPSFIVMNEQFGGLRLGFPLGNKGKIVFDGNYSDLDFRYYQVENFNNTDTADITSFYPFVGKIKYSRNSMNRKLFANRGSKTELEFIALQGDEVTLPGSTFSVRDSVVDTHAWIHARFFHENILFPHNKLKFVCMIESVYSTQKFFENYTATLLAAPAFEPIPDMKTYFLEGFRAFQYIGGGISSIYNLTDNLEVRAGFYFFQPFWSIRRDKNNKPVAGKLFNEHNWLTSSSLIYHSPIGPVSLFLNYYNKKEAPWSFSINFGYLIQNPKAIK